MKDIWAGNLRRGCVGVVIAMAVVLGAAMAQESAEPLVSSASLDVGTETQLFIDGLSVADCEPVTGDHINAEVQWKKDGAVATRAGKPTRMRFEMTNTSLYAFQSVDANSRSQH